MWAWLDDHAHTAAHVQQSIDGLYAHWQEVDVGPGGLLADPDAVNAEYPSLEVAEGYAIDVGYPTPAGYRHFHFDPMQSSVTGQLAESADDACAVNPGSAACYVTPQGGALEHMSWCQAAGVAANAPGLAAAVCDETGVKDWFAWALGITGVAVLVGTTYAVYRGAKAAAPYATPAALALGAPELLPAYLAARGGNADVGSGWDDALDFGKGRPGRGQDEARARVLRAIEEARLVRA